MAVSLALLSTQYLCGEADPATQLASALARSNRNQGKNVYLAQDPEWSRGELTRLLDEDPAGKPLWGIPVSLKDCFDLAGFPTSCGSRYYRERHGIATEDSAVAACLRRAGAVLTGKTHLHQLAYGITGENKDFGDCVQPRDACLLTGGSSSGAAASVQEGSALAAIGTDTGGSIRVPAALCGLAGYRSSLGLRGQGESDLWRGGAHLAPSFDTIGWLYRDLADGPLLARALFDLPQAPSALPASLSVGIPSAGFLHDCDADVLNTMFRWQKIMGDLLPCTFERFDASFWEGASAIFVPIQASEAAAIHRGHFEHFESSIAERLAWGASLPEREVAVQRGLHDAFRRTMHALFTRFDYLLLPCAPMSALTAHGDHSKTRARILRYTSPISLAGLPVVTLPGEAGGLQLVGPFGGDAQLLALSAAFAGMVASSCGVSYKES